MICFWKIARALKSGLIRRPVAFAFLMLLTIAIAHAADAGTNAPPIVQLSAQEDHHRLMGLLHMTSFRHRTTTIMKSPRQTLIRIYPTR